MKAFVFLLVTLGAGAAYVPAPPLRHRAHSLAARWPPIVASLSTLTDAATSTASLTSSSTPTALLADGGLFDSIAGIGALGVGLFVVVALLAGKGSLEAGAALMLVFFRGDPDEREASGANENELLKKLALSITPSAWKKAYQGEEGVEGSQALLDLPSWQGEEARALVEPEAVANIRAMQYEPFVVPGISTPVDTCFISQQPEGPPSEWPTVMLVHGFDSSLLEFRYIVPALLQAGLRVEAMEWFTGGFTARAPFLAALEADPEATPWDLARAHQLEFWKRQCAGQKVVLLGASLGGALAIDFAAAHPECVDRLVLMDAGGESYAQPEPFLTSLAADPVTNLFAWRAANGLLPYPHVWSKEGGWRQALRRKC